MRKKNGFISMSIIYSFFTVFILVSTSLLLIYSNNLSIVKSVNKEIKDDLTSKGNNNLMIFKNLILDGSFENYVDYWTHQSSGNTPELKEQKYYGKQSLGLIKGETDAALAKTTVESKYNINMIQGHYYYVSRVYMSYNIVRGQLLTYKLVPASNTEFDDTESYDILENAKGYLGKALKGTDDCGVGMSCCDNTTFSDDDCAFKNTSIERARDRYQSAFCLGVNGRCTYDNNNTLANTFESGIFQFTNPTGQYKVLIGADFSSVGADAGIAPRYHTDGYMMIDLNVALQLDDTKASDLLGGDNETSRGKRRAFSLALDELLDGRFIENQKTIPITQLHLS